MKRHCCLVLMLMLTSLCFTQTRSGETLLDFSLLFENFNFSLNADLFRPVSMVDENEENLQVNQNQSIFTNAPQWVKDLRRGEIVFFGSFPITMFFTRIFVDLYRMGRNNWDQRYAPWPFQSAGAVSMNTNELIVVFSIAVSASLGISITDHLIVKNKRKAAAAFEE